MNGITFYLPGGTAALAAAGQFLTERGINTVDAPTAQVTHLLLPVPSFAPDGSLKGGGDVVHILDRLPKTVTVMGGNLRHPALKDRKTVDFLLDEGYLAENAAITADCAIRIVQGNLPVVLKGCPILIVGWGRIGKCLAAMLKDMGADVTVAARKERDPAMLHALGYRTEDPQYLRFGLMRYRVICNTVPAPVLSREQTAHCRPDCVKIDLASEPGIDADDAIWARGLPGRDAPESAGLLIAKTAIRLSLGKETSL